MEFIALSSCAPAIVTRFAPSPTFYLHEGHAYAATIAWHRARQSKQPGSRFLLRLEDIDSTRCRPAFSTAIEEDLRWLGLDWDGPILRQSERLPLYRACLDRLAQRGLIYPCFCSRADISREIAAAASAPHTPDGAALYPGTCRQLSHSERNRRITEGAPHAWRLDMRMALSDCPPLFFTEEKDGDIAADPTMFGDVILARRDMPASYHLCVTCDDAAQGVTLVTRGEDLRPATHLHRLLQHLLGWPTPRYAHHPLLSGPDGKRLAKRDGALTLRALRAAGVQAEDIRKKALLF
jgi:glutamyl-Q tRNA(Asp) synthetase